MGTFTKYRQKLMRFPNDVKEVYKIDNHSIELIKLNRPFVQNNSYSIIIPKNELDDILKKHNIIVHNNELYIIKDGKEYPIYYKLGFEHCLENDCLDKYIINK